MKRIFVVLILIAVVAPLRSADRNVLCEMFTSTTCPPCVSANQSFDIWYASYAQKQKVVVVKYHVWWPSPGTDPYYASNTQQIRDRLLNYYAPASNYVPRMYVGGNVDGESNYPSWPGLITTRMTVPTAFTIAFSGKITPGAASTISINLTTDSTSIPSGTLVLHTLITESNLLYTGPNGDPAHHYVLRKMYPGATGELFSMSKNQTKSISRSITVDTSWKTANCELVAFVQIAETKEILQAMKIPLSSLTNASRDEMPNLPQHFVLAQNYPNPFNPTTTISYSLLAVSNVRLTVNDLLGREVAVLANEKKAAGSYSVQFNGSGLSSGVYICKLTAGSFIQTRRMILLK
jgi:hypothetical protein